MSLVIVRDEIDSRHERLDRCVEILIFLLQRPDHPVEGVRAQAVVSGRAPRRARGRRRNAFPDVDTSARAGSRARPDVGSARSVSTSVCSASSSRSASTSAFAMRQPRALVVRVEPDCRRAAGRCRARPRRPQGPPSRGCDAPRRDRATAASAASSCCPRVVNESASECGHGTRERIAVVRAAVSVVSGSRALIRAAARWPVTGHPSAARRSRPRRDGRRRMDRCPGSRARDRAG